MLEQLQVDGARKPTLPSSPGAGGGEDEANLWLRRCWWAEYLQGIHHEQLYDSIATLAEDAEGIEGVAHRTRFAMTEVGQISQLISKATCEAIHLDAARTEKD